MKKKILGVALIAAMAVAAGWNFNQSKNEVDFSELALENIDALALGEAYMGSGTCYGTGPNFTDVSCYGGYTICAWCHTNVYGKN